MEQKSISFGFGIQRSPSLATQSGELSEAVNLIPKNGELVNIKPPVDLTGITSSGTFRYVHNTSNHGSHYIFTNEETDGDATTYSIYYMIEGGGTTFSIDSDSGKVKEFSAMGNFLIANTENGLAYYLWKNADEGYQVLKGMPDMSFLFQLDGAVRWKTYNAGVKGVNTQGKEAGQEYTDALQTLTIHLKSGQCHYNWKTEQLLSYGLSDKEYFVIENNTPYPIKALLNNGYVVNNGESVVSKDKSAAMFVNASYTGNYALSFRIDVPDNIDEEDTVTIYLNSSGSTMTDQTVIAANTQENYEAILGSLTDYIDGFEKSGKKFVRPFLVRYGFRLYDGSVLYQSAPMLMLPNSGIAPVISMAAIAVTETNPLQVSAFVADLMIMPRVGGSSIAEEFARWKDVITGVVVAISQPIPRYKADWIRNDNYNDIEFWGYSEDNPEKLSNIYGVIGGEEKYLKDEERFKGMSAKFIIRPPYYTDAEVGKKIYSTSEFYVIKEFTPEELEALSTEEFTILDSKSRAVGGTDVTTLPSISDDYGSLVALIPEHIFTYNNRINVANLKYSIASPQGACSPNLTNYGTILSGTKRTRVITYLKINGKEIVSDSGWTYSWYSTRWIFFPSKRAYKFVIYRSYTDPTTGITTYYKLEGNYAEHKTLNGSYSYSSEELTFEDATEAEATADYIPNDNYAQERNAIYVSAAANPLYLPLTSTKSVGSGEIYAISTSAKAISSGTQFGTFPLYAFCSDGIWPLSVASDGTFDAPNPLSRDVLYHDDNVTGEVCQVDAAVVFPTEAGLKVVQGQEVVKASGSMEGYNTNEEQFFGESDPLVVTETDSIVEIISNAFFLYDYANALIHVYPKNPKSNEAGNYKHYVFSLQQKTWSTVVDSYGSVRAVVPGYPFSYIQCAASGQVMLYNSEEKNDELRSGVILTRPIAFDAPMSLKVLADLKIIYYSGGNASCKVQPYVSNDGVHWYKLTSLRSRAFKWFRFRISTSLTDLDTLTALDCLIEERRNNKLR